MYENENVTQKQTSRLIFSLESLNTLLITSRHAEHIHSSWVNSITEQTSHAAHTSTHTQIVITVIFQVNLGKPVAP